MTEGGSSGSPILNPDAASSASCTAARRPAAPPATTSPTTTGASRLLDRRRHRRTRLTNWLDAGNTGAEFVDGVGGPGGGNAAPVANFSSSVSGLTATFTDSSTDSDGTIASRSWNFGDGTTLHRDQPE